MGLTEFAINVVFIGTPGVICYFVLSRLIGRLGRTPLHVFLLIFMYAMGSYVSYAYAGRALASVGFQNRATELVLASPGQMTIRTADVGWASLFAVLLAYGLAYGYRYNAINWVGQRIRATNRAGDEDVWHFFHNASTEPWSSEWIVVRDHKVDLQYFGSVSHWSESGQDRELLLRHVSVFDNEDGTPLYECEHMYICRNNDDLTIEIHAEGRGESSER